MIILPLDFIRGKFTLNFISTELHVYLLLSVKFSKLRICTTAEQHILCVSRPLYILKLSFIIVRYHIVITSHSINKIIDL